VLTFQRMIAALQTYWEAQGCVILQPYHTEVGAGTSNPATFLRVLGPRPWRTVYVEPSIRPDDGRYGENPFRLQQFYQLQVILKPCPPDIQDLYLGSLESVGIDIASHDVRFVEDNWENPSLGASGLGWEVWMDGMEITQYTYFQQAGGVELDPISVELAYGLERLAMYLQGKDHVRDVVWTDNTTWGDVYLQNERQMSAYNYEFADTAMHARHFDDYEAETRRVVDAGLPLAAYDYLLKCSHAFNLLDSRRAIAVTDRAGYVLRMRRLAESIARAHLAIGSDQNDAPRSPDAAPSETSEPRRST
jgi:glycyl-tRNA synthetase alpha chain